MPEVYSAFLNGEFSVQMGEANHFGRNEADKTIENTINRDCRPEVATSVLVPILQQHSIRC